MLLGIDGGINTYAYAEGNPVELVDPNGLQASGGVSPIPGSPGWVKRWFDVDSCAKSQPTLGTCNGCCEARSQTSFFGAVTVNLC